MDNFDLTTLESIEKKLDGIETVTEDDNIDFTNDEDEVIDLNEI